MVDNQLSNKTTSLSNQETHIRKLSLLSPTNNNPTIDVVELENNLIIGKMMFNPGPQNNILYFSTKSMMDSEGYKLNKITLSQFGKATDGGLEENIIHKTYEKSTGLGDCNCQKVFKIGTMFPKFSILLTEEGLLKFALIASTGRNVFLADENFCTCEEIETGDDVHINDVMTQSSLVVYQSAKYQLIWNSLSGTEEYSVHRLRNASLHNIHDLDVYDPLRIKIGRVEIPRSCVIPEITSSINNEVNIIHKTANSLAIKIPKFYLNDKCSNVQSQIMFVVSYMLSNEANATFDCFEHQEDCNMITKTFSVDPSDYESKLPDNSIATSVTLTGLQPFSIYRIKIEARNAYGKLRLSNHLSNDAESHDVIEIVSQTAEGKPSEPRNVSVVVLSPEYVMIKWLPSLVMNGNRVKYLIKWSYLHSDDTSQFSEIVNLNSFHFNDSKDHATDNFFYHVLGSAKNGLKLLPGQSYKVLVAAKTEFPEESRSNDLSFTTFEQPNLVIIPKEHLKPRSMVVEWVSPNNDNIAKHEIKMMPLEEFNDAFMDQESEFGIDAYNELGFSILGFKSLSTNLTQPLQKYSYDFNDLSPGTTYVVFVQVTYKLKESIEYWNHNSTEYNDAKRKHHYVYQWPQDDRQIVATPPDKPLTPGPPYDEIVEGIPYLR